MSERFAVQQTPVLGGWEVLDTQLGRVTKFGTDKVGARDFADQQNRAQALAAKWAA